MTVCPWANGEPAGIGPNDPCPVCGMLGTVDAEDLCGVGEVKMLCTDCGDKFKYPTHDGRCPMCGSARVVPEQLK